MFFALFKTGFANLFSVFRLSWRKKRLRKIRQRLQNKLDNYYLSVGEQVVNRPEKLQEIAASAQNLADEINPLQQKLGAIVLQIAALDSTSLADTTPVIKYLPDQQEGAECPSCQAMVPRKSIFCPSCGARLITNDSTPPIQEETIR